MRFKLPHFQSPSTTEYNKTASWPQRSIYLPKFLGFLNHTSKLVKSKGKKLFLQIPVTQFQAITRIPTAASFNVSGHFILAVLISPVFLYFVGAVAVGAYQMQNSTPAVPKRPQWVQISAPLLLVLLLDMLLQQKDDGGFFFIMSLLNLVVQIFEWF